MDSATCPTALRTPVDPDGPVLSAKIVVAGGFGVGKTTLVAAISEMPPLNTDAWMTSGGQGVDPEPHSGKGTTTVAMDFGRRTLDAELALFLFGTPGQPRFWFMWDDLVRGALGAIVLVDTHRLHESFAAVEYFQEHARVPYVVAVNQWNGRLSHPLDEIRHALVLPDDVPLLTLDARDAASVNKALQDVVAHALRFAV